MTTPVDETTATAGFEEVQGVVASAVAEPVKVIAEAIHTLEAPEIVGRGLTVNVAVCTQPKLLV